MKNKLVIGAFILMIAASVCMLLLPADKESIEKENRTMNEIPEFNKETVFSGEFETGFEGFIGDNVTLRSFFLDVSKWFDEIKGFTPDTGKIVSTTKDIGTGTTQKQTLLVAHNAVMEMFMRNSEEEEIYAEAVNHYAKKLPDNVSLYNMIIPTQLSFQEPMYKNLQDDQQDTIKSIYDRLDERVKTVDAYGALEKHSDEYIYFRTDHHWTQLGAYYAYCEFMREAGGKSVKKEDFEKNTIQNVLGYLYDRADSSDVDVLPDKIEWYNTDPNENIDVAMYTFDEDNTRHGYNGIMFDRTKASYQFFFGSDHEFVEMVNNDIPDGKTLVLLRESYSNVLAPWLIQSYHKVILIDPRGFKGDFQYILDSYSPDDVMIVNYIFTTKFPDYCNLLEMMY